VSTRREERRIAIDILYQADLTDAEPADVVTDWIGAGREVPSFSRELIEGVADEMPGIDLLLEESSEGWSVARMPALDRTTLRLAIYELRYRDDIPPSVAINEAVETVNELSTEDSGRFVNGILGKIARDAAAPD
jgi:N utilization substance protein B